MASRESYKHKAAKAVVIGWLRAAAAAAGYDGSATTCNLSWRVNRRGPEWGVWDEYPIALDPDGTRVGDRLLWDETDWWQGAWSTPCVCEPFILCECRPYRPPSYEALLAMRYRPLAILDIAVQHKGAILYGIEIVHTSAPSAEKVAILDDLACQTLVLDAEWVLRQVAPPALLAVIDVHGPSTASFTEPLRRREVA